jgi:hypothetical protein
MGQRPRCSARQLTFPADSNGECVLPLVQHCPLAAPYLICLHLRVVCAASSAQLSSSLCLSGLCAPAGSLLQDKMHGVVRFDPKTGVQQKGKPKTGSYTNYFADALIAEAERDNRIVAVHAAMAGGTGVWVRVLLG